MTKLTRSTSETDSQNLGSAENQPFSESLESGAQPAVFKNRAEVWQAFLDLSRRRDSFCYRFVGLVAAHIDLLRRDPTSLSRSLDRFEEEYSCYREMTKEIDRLIAELDAIDETAKVEVAK